MIDKFQQIEKVKFSKMRIANFYKVKRIVEISDDDILVDLDIDNEWIERENDFDSNDIFIALLRIGMYIEKRILKSADTVDFLVYSTNDETMKVAINGIQKHKLYEDLKKKIIDFIGRFGSHIRKDKNRGFYLFENSLHDRTQIDLYDFIRSTLEVLSNYYLYTDDSFYKDKDNDYHVLDVRQLHTQSKVSISLEEFENHDKSKIFKLVYTFPTVFEFAKFQNLMSVKALEEFGDSENYRIAYCEYCHIPFQNPSGRQKFCCTRHMKKYNQNIKAKAKRLDVDYDNDNVPEYRLCEREGCYNAVESDKTEKKRKTKRYCSDYCMRKAKRDAKKNEDII